MAKKQEPEKMKEDLLLDVKEQMAEERRNYLLKKYGTFLGYCALGIVVSFGGYEAWKSYDQNSRQGMGDLLITEINAGKPEINAADFAGQSGFEQLATMAKAAAFAGEGKSDEAIAEYQKVWDDSGSEPAIQKLAKLKAAILIVNSSSGETPKLFDATDDEVFDAEFNELVAVHAIKNSNNEKAEEILTKLNESDDVSPTVKSRANAYLSEIESN